MDTHHLTRTEVEDPGAWALNGRQIKHALAMMLIWCKWNGKPVTLEAVENIISVACPRAGKEEERWSAKGRGRNGSGRGWGESEFDGLGGR